MCLLQLIYKHWMNTLMNYCGPFTAHSGYCQRLKAFITINLQWVQDQIAKQPNSTYWHQVQGRLWLFYQANLLLGILIVKGPEISLCLSVFCEIHLALLQLKGLEDSYNDQLSFPTGPLSFNPFGFM